MPPATRRSRTAKAAVSAPLKTASGLSSVRVAGARPLVRVFLFVGFSLAVFGGALAVRLVDPAAAAIYQAPQSAPPQGNIPMTIWNRRASNDVQETAKIEIDGEALLGKGLTAGLYLKKDPDPADTYSIVVPPFDPESASPPRAGENAIYGVGDYDSFLLQDNLLKLETYKAGGFTPRLTANKNGDLYVAGCAAAAFVGLAYIGVAPAGFKGGDASSYVGANNRCNTAFAGSHVCTVQEILESVKCAADAAHAGAPIRSAAFNGLAAWVNGGPPGYTAYADDCLGWSDSTTAHYGRVWNFYNVTGGTGTMTSCNVSSGMPYACCK